MFNLKAKESCTTQKRLTKRAPDKWDSAAFSSIFLASSFSCSQTLSQPAHLRVTQTVRRRIGVLHGKKCSAQNRRMKKWKKVHAVFIEQKNPTYS